jgi:hypothetical protein
MGPGGKREEEGERGKGGERKEEGSEREEGWKGEGREVERGIWLIMRELLPAKIV